MAIAGATAIATLPAKDQGIGSFGLLVAVIPIWIVLFKLYGLYDRDERRISHGTVDDLPHLFHVLVLGSLGVWAYSKLALPNRLELSQGVWFFLSAGALITAGRSAVRTRFARHSARERVAFIGTGAMASILLRKIRGHDEYGLEPVGYFARDADHDADSHFPYLGNPVTGLARKCDELAVRRILIVGSDVDQSDLAEIVRQCSDLELKISILPNLAEVLGSGVTTDAVEGVAVLGLSPPKFSRTSRWMKRAIDVFVAAAVLLITSPVLALVGLTIKLTSRGPVFFRQERIGRGGKRFRIYKFRTMVADAESLEAELVARSHHPAWLLVDNDPRVTRIGRFLRRTSIDELPQLLNVLKGEMSLVGPRPMPPAVDGQIFGWGRRRLDLTPGITGLWQALGRTQIPFEEMVNLDYLYVTNWSLWQDVSLILRTLPTIVSRRGAN